MTFALLVLGSIASLFCSWAKPSALAQHLKVAVISQSANNWPLFVAEEKGFFQREGLHVEVVVSGDSGRQINGLAAGEYHITHQASDHFMRAVEEGKDLVVFMTISRPIFDFIVQPEIRTIADLRGKTIALDRPTTGYWLLFQKAFARHGLPSDAYKILPNLGGAEARYRAVKENRAQGTFLNPPLSLNAIAQGFPRLTNLSEHFPDLPGSSGGVRRNWAKENEATLIRYLRGYAASSDWLLDAKNRDEAEKIFARKLKLDAKDAKSSYDSFVRVGLVPGGKLSMEGIRQVIELMSESGQLKSAPSGPERYADPSFQQKAAQATAK
jgi:ABC-type nitrate/sulfonate/bicarbonate transport system substrate-binding protein